MNGKLASLLLIGLAGPCSASSAGADPLNFLFLDANARVVALGGAYTALAADSNALLYNPAGLAVVPRHEATFMHNQYFQGVTQEYLSYASPYGLGASFNSLSLSGVQQTTLSNPDGTGLGTAGLSDLAVSGGYGHAVGAGLSLGVGAKLIRETIAGVAAQGYGADVGALWAVPAAPGLSLGAAMQNLGPAIKFQSAQESLPLNFRAGAAYAFKVLGQSSLISADVAKERSDTPIVSAGAETVIAGALALRVGYNGRNAAGPGIAVGGGWVSRDFGVDYAFVPFGDLGNAHRISATVRWGGAAAPSAAKAPVEGAPETRLAQAQAAMDRGDYVAAKSFLIVGRRDLPPGDRRRVRFQERLGSLLRLQGDCAGANQAYTEGINLAYADGYSDQSVADSYLGIGMCFMAEKNFIDAERNFRKGLTIGPSPAMLKLAQEQLKALKLIASAP